MSNATVTGDPLVALFDGLLSGNVSDAMESLGMRRSVITGYTMLGPEGAAIAGRAFTIRQLRKHGADERSAQKTRHIEVSRDLAHPGDIIVIDTGGMTDVATWGELHTARCVRRGITGVVTNGATRDADLLRKMELPVFCRGFTPVKSMWDFETVSLNAPVTLDGVQIRDRDIIVADETGIIVIPPERAQEVAEIATKIRVAEEAAMRDEAALRAAAGKK
jgi:regulator of RNase E activity RraA